MTRQCLECQRLNPPEALYCFHDGKPLVHGAGTPDGSSIDFSTWAFPRPFVFPSGQKCHNFLQLAVACHEHPQETMDAVQHGFFEAFFGSLGRADLAMAARAAGKAPDHERGLDDFLGKLPGSPLKEAELALEPEEVKFGVLPVGEDRTFELKLKNRGDRLVHGKAAVENCPWLVLGDSGTPEKLFQFFETATIPVHVRGKRLRARSSEQRVEIAVESNGGNYVVAVRVTVPVKPFPQGVLSGATSPRQLAEKAKAHPKEAAVLLEQGEVARWYESNGWDYPVQGPTATGIAAVQQLFEVLGLVKVPKVELSESAVALNGRPGERLEHTLTVLTQEKKAAVAHAVSDQPWLTVGKTLFRGQSASIPLTVEAVPNEPRQRLTAHLKVVGNGSQRFDVPVTLQVGDGPPVSRPGSPTTPTVSPSLATTEVSPSLPVATFAADEDLNALPSPLPDDAPAVLEIPEPEPPVMPAPAPVPAAAAPVAVAVVPAAPAGAGGGPSRRKQLIARLLPVGIALLGLLTAVGHDIFFREEADDQPLPEVDYKHPVLDVQFHDAPLPGDFLRIPTMRFGLGRPDPKNPNKFETKLIYDEFGRTCNVCVRVNKTIEYLWGVEQGAWDVPIKKLLPREKGHRPNGAECIWKRTTAPPITIKQHVEIIPGGLSKDGKKRLLDTCLVYYDILNEDKTQAHTVALRFMLDTFIGGNDAVPFTIAGARELCDTSKSFNKPSEVPDYISALERQDLKDPGTVAHLTLRYGGLEPPSRVTLGAWPAASLRKQAGGEKADMQNTRWEVPVLDMDLAKSAQNPNGDSAVTMYWDDKEIKPGETRRVGFAYGLGSVAGDESGGQLGMTAGGELVADKEFTLTAYVKDPVPGMTVTLTLPKSLKLAGGNLKEPVPEKKSGSYSPVTWRVKATKSGVHRVEVKLSTGAKLKYRLAVKPAGIFK
jgi:hypothetical protein